MVKLLNWLSKILFQTLLVAGLTIYLTWAAVQTYVDKILQQYNLDSSVSKVQFSDFLLQLSDDANILKPTRSQTVASGPSTGANSDGTNGSAVTSAAVSPRSQAESATTPAPGSQAAAGSNNKAESQAVATPAKTSTEAPATAAGSKKQADSAAAGNGGSEPVFKQDDSSGQQELDQNKSQQNVLMTAAQFTQIKDKITDNDKMKIFSLLATKLPEADLQQFSTYLESGVTEAEWENIQEIVKKYLTTEEYNQLLGILAKY